MHVIAIALTTLAALVGLEWIVRNVLALRVWSGSFHLTEDYKNSPPAGEEQQTPLLSIVRRFSPP